MPESDRPTLEMLRIRKVLEASQTERLYAVASFPLRVVSMANDLKRLLDLGPHASTDSAKLYIERQFKKSTESVLELNLESNSTGDNIGQI